MKTKTEATIEDLYRIEGKAELVNGEIVYISPTGRLPGYAGDEIYAGSAYAGIVVSWSLIVLRRDDH